MLGSVRFADLLCFALLDMAGMELTSYLQISYFTKDFLTSKRLRDFRRYLHRM